MDVAALLAGIYPDTLPGYLAIEISVIPDAVKLRAAGRPQRAGTWLGCSRGDRI
jgi:hypothetical protein